MPPRRQRTVVDVLHPKLSHAGVRGTADFVGRLAVADHVLVRDVGERVYLRATVFISRAGLSPVFVVRDR